VRPFFPYLCAHFKQCFSNDFELVLKGIKLLPGGIGAEGNDDAALLPPEFSFGAIGKEALILTFSFD
jgi:hypothetical protein